MKSSLLIDFKLAKKKLGDWGHKNPLISALVVYGSHVRKTANEKSDFDIAVVVETEPGDEDQLATFWYHEDEWKEELRQLLNFSNVDLQWYGGDETPRVKAGIEESKIVVYDKIGIF